MRRREGAEELHYQLPGKARSTFSVALITFWMAYSRDEGALSEKGDPEKIRVNRCNSRFHIRQTAGTRRMAAHLWLGFGFFPTVSGVSRPLLSSTISFRDGFIPATQRTRCCSYNTRYLHPNSKHRQGRMWHPARSNCLQFCDCPPHHDSGTFPPFCEEKFLTRVV
jgi:hypothetical protein